MNTVQNLSLIAPGMDVYDSNGQHIGSVEDFHFGEGTLQTSKTENASIVDTIAAILGKRINLPMVVYHQLYAQGFAYIKGSWLRPNRLILPNQIEKVSDDEVYLNVSQDELVQV